MDEIDRALSTYPQRKLYTEEGFLGVTATRETLLSDSGLLLPRDGNRAVGLFPRSRSCELGLEDMAGNVWEWCEDWYKEGVHRVIRGGCWLRSAEGCRSSVRGGGEPSDRFGSIGFRVARSPSVE